MSGYRVYKMGICALSSFHNVPRLWPWYKNYRDKDDMRLCLYRLALISASWCLIQYPSIPRINDEFLVKACPSKSTTERMRLILHINTSQFSAVLPNPIVFQLYLKNLLNCSCSKGVLVVFMSSALPFHQKAPGSSLCLPSRERQNPSRKRPMTCATPSSTVS
jgi:hypothetical protein